LLAQLGTWRVLLLLSAAFYQADQDEIDREIKQREKAADSSEAKRARAEKKKIEALKKKTGSKKLGRAGSADEEDPENSECVFLFFG
jgi:uncharacterized protein YdaU (DUF1376 family)